jgi:hypothetical protein
VTLPPAHEWFSPGLSPGEELQCLPKGFGTCSTHGKRLAYSKESPQQNLRLITVPEVVLAYDKG